MSAVLKHDLSLRWVDCACGITFAVPQYFYDVKYEQGGHFFCPNGHTLSWSKTEADRVRTKMQAEIDEALRRLEFARNAVRTEREQREEAQKRLSVAKGQITRIKNRISKGVCPCCKRTFQNLHRHMNSKHPDYAASE